jgi:hypothetical protein
MGSRWDSGMEAARARSGLIFAMTCTAGVLVAIGLWQNENLIDWLGSDSNMTNGQLVGLIGGGTLGIATSIWIFYNLKKQWDIYWWKREYYGDGAGH